MIREIGAIQVIEFHINSFVQTISTTVVHGSGIRSIILEPIAKRLTFFRAVLKLVDCSIPTGHDIDCGDFRALIVFKRPRDVVSSWLVESFVEGISNVSPIFSCQGQLFPTVFFFGRKSISAALVLDRDDGGAVGLDGRGGRFGEGEVRGIETGGLGGVRVRGHSSTDLGELIANAAEV